MTECQGKARVWLEVDLQTVRENFRAVASHAAPAGVFTVLKANAYSMGGQALAEVLSQEKDCAGFCVATLEEALSLKKWGKSIQILGPVLDFELEEVVANDFILGINSAETAQKVSETALRQNKKARCHIKLDTGMGRFGVLSGDLTALEEVAKAVTLPGLDCCGAYTHFPSSEYGEVPANLEQIGRFLESVEFLKKKGVALSCIHMANSDAIQLLTGTRQAPFTHVRAGLILHGAFSGERNKAGVKQVFTLKSRLAAVRKMPAGHPVGYNSTCVLEKDCVVGLVSAGYADGIPLGMSNKGFVLIRGKRCPVLGRVSMDYMSVLLSGFPEGAFPETGEEVTLIGNEGDSSVTVEEYASWKGTHPYEILTSLSGNRVKRFYK